MRILVTGGSSEIGMAIATRRIQVGDEVIITASSEESLAVAEKKFKDSGMNVLGMVFNLSDPQASLPTLQNLLSVRLDGLVLNAATSVKPLRRFHEISESNYKAYIESNIFGNLWLIQKVLEKMVQFRFGRLIFISSASVAAGTSRYGTYCLAKTGMEGLFLNLAVDYGEFNILSNVVRPGIIATERNKRFWKRSHFIDRMSEMIPVKAMGLPHQIAEATDPLFSASSYVNGSIFTVSGGLPMVRSEGVLQV